MCNLAPSFARHIGRTDEDGPRALDSCAGGAVVICFSGFLGGVALTPPPYRSNVGFQSRSRFALMPS